MRFGNTIKRCGEQDIKKLEGLCRENAIESCKHLGIEFDESRCTLHFTEEEVKWEYNAH